MLAVYIIVFQTGLTALSNINNSANALSQLDREETDKTGVKMTAAQRSALMQSLMSSHGWGFSSEMLSG